MNRRSVHRVTAIAVGVQGPEFAGADQCFNRERQTVADARQRSQSGPALFGDEVR
jgi:hypothetical protein